MESNSFAQAAAAWGPYAVAVMVPAMAFIYQLLIEKRKSQAEWGRLLAERSLDACLTVMGETKALADEWASWNSSRDPRIPPGLRSASKRLKENADYLRPLLPADVRDELHTAAYHIWGLIEVPEHSELDISTFGGAIGRVKVARDKLETYLDRTNPIARAVK